MSTRVEKVILKDPIYKEEARAGTGGGEDTAPGPSTSQNLQDGASSTGSRRRYDNEFNFKILQHLSLRDELIRAKRAKMDTSVPADSRATYKLCCSRHNVGPTNKV